MQKQAETTQLSNDPLWYKDAIIYQIHVRAFSDSNGDGIGDFRGLTEKLDYLDQLGVTALWLLPFYPSPLKDDGYDIADYTTVHPSYGNLRDFNQFLKEAHRRGLRVITELVINHTSDQHQWFQRARKAPQGSKERDFYVWSDTAEKYKGTRIIFKDFEPSNWSLDPVTSAYYWHRFYTHQPDLNFDSPEMQESLFEVLEMWLGRGVDGLRLDAIPYLYEREGTGCENLPETHAFLKKLRSHIDNKFKNRMLLAEANQWPEDAVAYFGEGDECHMAFHFPLMPRLFMATRLEDRYPIIEILEQTPSIPGNAQWATFLRNHDELTLEMVTDRERDYMYQVYARDRAARINLGIRRRLAPLLGNERRAIELMNFLYFSLPGTPVIYYGDEIGMGDNIFLGDRNGVRTPMQWSPDRNAGFSRANSQRLYLPVVTDSEYHYEAVNVEAQQNNPRSLLWWMKRLINFRKRYKAFSRGNIEFYHPANTKILAFKRSYEDEHVLVVVNLSRFAQSVELDLSSFKGTIPVEIFGHTDFPPITNDIYPMTLGPYAYYWFDLQRASGTAVGKAEPVPAAPVHVAGNWYDLLEGRNRSALEQRLTEYLATRRWFGGKSRRIQAVRIRDAVRISGRSSRAYILLVDVDYPDGVLETYTVPLTLAEGEKAAQIREQYPTAVFGEVQAKGSKEGLLYDALWDKEFVRIILDAMARQRNFNGDHGELVTSNTSVLKRILQSVEGDLEPVVSKGEQSNTTVFLGDKLILKLFRRLEPGVNPELEIGSFLTEKAGSENTPPLAGAMEYRSPQHEPMTVAVLQGFTANEGDAWRYTQDHLGRYYEEAVTRTNQMSEIKIPQKHVLVLAEEDPPPFAKECFGFYLEQAKLLGQRTAELHLALASDPHDPNFAPEPFSDFYKRSQYQGMRGLCNQVFQTFKNHLKNLPDDVQEKGKRLLDSKDEILRRFAPIRDRRFAALRIRTHGDYHLGQVLYTGKDFVVTDFEGEPARSLSERRNKSTPLRDVAGMLRSFHYASIASEFSQAETVLPALLEDLEPWKNFWHAWVTASFLNGYMRTASGASFLPAEREEIQILLDAYTLDKAIYELGYELNNRPQWATIPVEGILQIVRGTVG